MANSNLLRDINRKATEIKANASEHEFGTEFNVENFKLPEQELEALYVILTDTERKRTTIRQMRGNICQFNAWKEDIDEVFKP